MLTLAGGKANQGATCEPDPRVLWSRTPPAVPHIEPHSPSTTLATSCRSPVFVQHSNIVARDLLLGAWCCVSILERNLDHLMVRWSLTHLPLSLSLAAHLSSPGRATLSPVIAYCLPSVSYPFWAWEDKDHRSLDGQMKPRAPHSW